VPLKGFHPLGVKMKSCRLLFVLGLGTLACAQAIAGPLIIGEFRVRGPSGANDEFIEIYNPGATAHTVAPISGTGYGVAASDGVNRCVIPTGTVIPAHGHYLCTNSVAYSLSGYATGDATYTTDIPDNAGIALFNNSTGGGSYTLANRMDAVGSTSEANTLYKEGTGYSALTPFSIDYSFYRDICGKAGSITVLGLCPAAGYEVETDSNVPDFVFVDTNGTSAGAGQRLGAPGPENLAAPITNGTGLAFADLDSCVANSAPPNRVRDFTSDPANNSTFGTLDIRTTYTNNTGAPLTALRFRIADLTTFPAPSGFADLRPRTSTLVVVTVDRPPCMSGTSNVNVQGTTLEQPPSQPNGSGFNGSMRVSSITPGTPLAIGASVDVRILLGIQQTGTFKLGLVPEGLPEAGVTGGVVYAQGCTDAVCNGPTVTSINRADPNPTAAASVAYNVVFSAPVNGVDTTDFALTNTGISGASVASVTGSNANYTVNVNTGTGSGTLRLDIVDDDTIVAQTGGLPLGGVGLGNGNFNGQVYDIDRAGPTVTVEQAVGQADPTGASPINFTVTFSESVANFVTGDVTLGGTAGATTATVTGGPTVYNVAVSGMTANGSVIASVAAGAATDTLGNGNTASTSTDNTVAFNGIDVTPPSVTVEQAVGQADPTGTSPINFTVTFSENVANFVTGDVTLAGTAGATTATVTGGPTVYNVAVSGMTVNGTVIASVAAGVATDAAGNPNTASTSVDNSVTFDGFDVTPPSVTIEQAVGQADPTGTSPINFTVTFSENVANFVTGDVTLAGTAGATTATVTGGPTVYNVAVSGMTVNGTVIATVAAGVATDAAGNPNTASTSVDNSVTFDGFDVTPPSVTIDQAVGQADPTATGPINFTVTFSEAVTGFVDGEVTLSGTAGANASVVTGGPSVYNVAVSGMTVNGTVIVSVPAGVATDAAGNANTASTSTDNSVSFTGGVVVPASYAPIPALSPAMLALLALALGGLAAGTRRRQRG
jgi:hypothetical protein